MATTEDLGATTRRDATRALRARGHLWWALPGALVGAVVMYVAHRGLIDDAYITLSYARNVAEHLHWGMIPTEESNTATSPLNVILLAVATWISGVTGALRPVVGLGILTVALSAAMAVWAAQIARRINVSGAWSLAVLAVVFANPFVNSAIGLEVVPIAAFLTGLTAQAVHGRRVAFGILAGLLVLTRPDLAIVVAVMYLATPALRRRFWVAPLTALVVALPWWVFSWYHFGSAIPTTLVIKTLQKSFGDATFGNGLWKMWQAGTTLPLSLALVPAAVGLLTVLCMLAVGLRRPAACRALAAGGARSRRPRGLRRVLPARRSALPLVLRVVDGRARGDRRVRAGTVLLKAPADGRPGRAARRPGRRRRGAHRRRRRVLPRPRDAVGASGDLRQLGDPRAVHGHRRGDRRVGRRCHREVAAGDRHGRLRVRLLGRRRVLRPGTARCR